MKENLKKLAKYYKPYLGTFIIDMILAMMSAAVALVIPLVVRYIRLLICRHMKHLRQYLQ